MRIKLATVALYLAPFLGLNSAFASEAAREFELSAKGHIAINTDGSVSHYSIETKNLTEEVLSLIDKSVSAWRFEPIIDNGSAIEAQSTMRLKLLATPNDDGTYSLEIDHASFGTQYVQGKRSAPAYPKSALDLNLGAKVLVQIKVGENGEVLEAHPYQVSLSHPVRSERTETRVRKHFEVASVNAIKQWRFEPLSLNAQVKRESTLLVPIHFSTQQMGNQKWSSFIPGPVSPAPWVKNDIVPNPQDIDRLKEGDTQLMDSPFKLINNPSSKQS